jgi:hypothetical protein
MYNQNLFPARTKNWHNSTTGKKVPPAHAKRVYLFLCLSFRPSVRAKRVELKSVTEKQETPVENFSKIKKPDKYYLGNQTKFSIFFEKQSWLYGCRSIQSKKELVFSYVGFKEDWFYYKESSWYFWETIVTVRYSYKINFPTTRKKLTQPLNCIVH